MESLMPTKCLIEDLVCNKHLIKINCFQFPKYIHLNIYFFITRNAHQTKEIFDFSLFTEFLLKNFPFTSSL